MVGFPWWLRGEESTCNGGDTGSIPGLDPWTEKPGGYRPLGHKETNMTASEHAHMQSEMGSKPEACKDAGQLGTASLAQWGSGPMGLAQAGASNHVPVTTSPDGGGGHAVCGAQVQAAGVGSQTSGSGPRAQGFSTACVHGKCGRSHSELKGWNSFLIGHSSHTIAPMTFLLSKDTSVVEKGPEGAVDGL